jgi:hypothetical protein
MNDSHFQEEVHRCAAEMRTMLPALAKRYSPLVLVAALTEHVGGGLFLSQEAQVCTEEQARAIIQRVEEIAFT